MRNNTISKISLTVILMFIGYYSSIVLASTTNNDFSNSELITNSNAEVQTILVSYVLSDYNGFEISTPGGSDGHIDITVSGGVSPYSFLWSTGDITEDIYNIPVGTYSLCVFDGTGEMMIIIIELNSPDVHTLELVSGWSMISSYICPGDLSIVSIFAPVLSNLSFVKDGDGNAYWPQYGVNMIGTYTAGEGYYIKMLDVDNLFFTGTILQPENLVIDLPIDWSIMGYPRTDPGLISDMLLPITNDIDIVKNTLGMIFWPSLNLDMIGNMMPGEGYQIKMLSSESFSFPTNDGTVSGLVCPQNITDYDGNSYNIVQIGSDCWMAENLRVTHFSDGTSMVNGSGVGNVSGDYITKYYFDYNDDPLNSVVYGRLYTWASMLNGAECGSIVGNTQGACPSGWHIPNEIDWNNLMGNVDSQYGLGDVEWDGTGFLGFDVGGNLKESGSQHWNLPNSGGLNTQGFSALPGGYRLGTGAFINLGANAYFWSAQANCSFYGLYRKLGYNNTTVYRNIFSKSNALSIRCVKDN